MPSPLSPPPFHSLFSFRHASTASTTTGLIAALILAVCGLSDEEIFDDYEKSQTYLAPCMHLIQIEGMLRTWTPGLIFNSFPALIRPESRLGS